MRLSDTPSNVYGNGLNSTQGANTIVHYYDKAGVKAANRVNVYGQFASFKEMPQNMGKKFKISKFLHMYDRNPRSDAEFAAKGYMTSRTMTEVSEGLHGATLAEGAGAVNKVGIQKITMEATLARYGEMLPYTDEVEMFSEDVLQVRYREELAALANSRFEDLIQLDMLATPTVIYSGTAVSKATIGKSIYAIYTANTTTNPDGSKTVNMSDEEISNADAEYKVSYDLIRKAVAKLTRNRAKKNTSIVTGDVKIGTTPINAAFYAIIGPQVKFDLENLVRGTGYERQFVYNQVQHYANASKLAEGECGSMYDVRFIESEAAVVFAAKGALVPYGYAGHLSHSNDGALKSIVNTTGADVTVRVTSGGVATDRVVNAYSELDVAETDTVPSNLPDGISVVDGERFDVFPILFPTQDAFATVGLKGSGKIKFNSAPPSMINQTNPYGTNGFFSYNFWYAGLILQEEKLLCVNVAATA